MGLHIGYKCKCQQNLVQHRIRISVEGSDGQSTLTSEVVTKISEIDEPNVIEAPTIQAPSAPRLASIVAGDQMATITWTAADDGGYDGSPIIKYQYSLDGFNWVDIPGENPVYPELASYTVTGLSYDVEQNIRLRAVNAVGQEGTEVSLPVTPAKDYDRDGDGLIEVSSLAQLNAIRFDPDGDGESDDPAYGRAFPPGLSGMGCPSEGGCAGYELMADLDFDTDGDGDVDANDDYWNDGAGWEPIGTHGYTSWLDTAFDGNGHVIRNLFINDTNNNDVGLFGRITVKAEVRNLGLESVDVTGNDVVGGLVGYNRSGKISYCYVTGTVTGDDWVGGLVGDSTGRVHNSYSTASVAGDERVGGLVGSSSYIVEATYTRGPVTGNSMVGGLIGENASQLKYSYSIGSVTAAGTVGGLVGSSRGKVIDGYWATDTSGQSASAGGTGLSSNLLRALGSYGVDDPEGIYDSWNSEDGHHWDFGTPLDYPKLYGLDGQHFNDPFPIVD